MVLTARSRTLRCSSVRNDPSETAETRLGLEAFATKIVAAIELVVVASLLIVAVVVLARTVVTFLEHWSAFPESVVAAIDGILVVIILLDIGNTVLHHLRESVVPIKPFLVIGILAGVRDILSSSAHLTLTRLTTLDLDNTLISLGVSVGVVVLLLLGLLILRLSSAEE